MLFRELLTKNRKKCYEMIWKIVIAFKKVFALLPYRRTLYFVFHFMTFKSKQVSGKSAQECKGD